MSRFHIDPNIARARTISTEVYTSAAIYEEAKEKIFASSWQFVGDTDRVGEPGSVWPFMLLDQYLSEPLLLSRDKTGTVHCLSNVCTHRGNLLAYEPCKSSQLRCRYHGRVFGLDGKFQFMPEFSGVENFPTEADNLKQLRLVHWGKLLFTTLNPIFPAEKFLGEMMQRVAWMPLDRLEYRPDLSKDYTVNANWALYCENYLEGFHIPFVHNSLSAVLDWNHYSTELFPYANLQLGIAKKGDACFDLPADSPDFGMDVAAYYFWVFPNMMFNFYPWGLSLNIVEPQTVSTCKVRFKVYVFDESKLNTGAGSGLEQVEHEDEEVVENVQRGIRSRFYEHGRYSPNREQGTHHFHGLLAEFLG
ncbi:MAG: aromatic ring-hydroxylating dioxygenase subunit alpha [Lewinellaceae bacterium]|nr:aromatic ring-hydroxylating dioxygenase subunit alpha [Lewinellaceae bacterium]